MALDPPLYLLWETFDPDTYEPDLLFGVLDLEHAEAQVQERVDRLKLEGENAPQWDTKVEDTKREERDNGDIRWTIRYSANLVFGTGRQREEVRFRAQLVVVNMELA